MKELPFNTYTQIFPKYNFKYQSYIPSYEKEYVLDQIEQEPSVQKIIYDDEAAQDTTESTQEELSSEYSMFPRFKQFNQIYNEIEEEYPEAKLYRRLLTKIAAHESGFNFEIKNKNAPAYGCFQFWQDGNLNNITHFSNLTIDEYLHNPKAQILSALRLVDTIKGRLTEEDIEKAKNMGITVSGLIGGAWLGGVSGVRKVLNGTGNPSDAHWNKNGKGSNVADCMKRYNNL